MNVKVGEVILSELKKIHSRSYFDRAERNAVFPYVVFTCPSSFKQQDSVFNIILRIDIFSNSGNNIASLEQITSSIVTALSQAVYNDSNMILKFELDSILQVPDTEEQIRRRELTFNVKYFSKEA